MFYHIYKLNGWPSFFLLFCIARWKRNFFLRKRLRYFPSFTIFFFIILVVFVFFCARCYLSTVLLNICLNITLSMRSYLFLFTSAEAKTEEPRRKGNIDANMNKFFIRKNTYKKTSRDDVDDRKKFISIEKYTVI